MTVDTHLQKAGLAPADLANVGNGTGSSDYAAWGQLFLDSFTIAVSQSLALNLEAKGAVVQTKAIPLESDATSIIQTAAVPLESRLGATQTAVVPLEIGTANVTQTAAVLIEARGPVSQTARPNLEAGGAATAIATATMNLEKIMFAGSYIPTPRSYYESLQAPAYTAVLPVESSGVTVTESAPVNLEATRDPGVRGVLPLESLPHVIAPIAGIIPLAALKWLTRRAVIPFDFVRRIGSASVGILPIETHGPVIGPATLDIEAQLAVRQTAVVPVELPRLAAHNAVDLNAETFERVVTQVTINLESPPESIVIELPASAEGFLTIIKGGDGTLIIHEALPLSESRTD